MGRLLAKASALFFLGIFAGSFIATPAIEVDTETKALTQVQSAYPYLQAVSESQIPTPNSVKVVASEASIDARFAGMLSHVKWLISGEAVTDKDNEIVRINKQIYSLMDDIGEDNDEDVEDDSSSSTLTNPVFSGAVGSNIPLGSYYLSGDGGNEGILIDASGNVQLTAGLRDTSGDIGTSGQVLLSSGSGTNWVSTSTLGIDGTLSNNAVVPDYLLSSGQTDEYCLTYEMTGDTWEWQLCGSGSSSFATTSIDTSLKLANIVTNETGSGALVFANSPTFSGTTTVNGFVNVDAYSGYKQSGSLVLYSTSTTFSTFVGREAGGAIRTNAGMYGNNAFGYRALNDPLLDSDSNNAFGNYALSENTTGGYNNAFGEGALNSNTVGETNNAFGGSSLYGNTTGFSNNAFGDSALNYNETGSYNNAFGYTALAFNVGGHENVAFGRKALFSNENGSYNVAVGSEAGQGGGYYSATGTISVGYRAGFSITNGADYNIFLGYQSGENVSSGQRNIIIGYDVDNISATANNRLNIGNLVFGSGIDGTGTTLSSGNIGIGTTTPNAKLTVHGNLNISQASGVIQFGGTRYLYASTTNDSVVFGEFAGNSFTSGTTYNIAFGYEAGRNMTNASADFMTLIGYQAGYQNTGDHTNIVGFGAGYQNSGDYTSIMGPSAGIANSGDYNNLIGAFAGRNNTGGFNNFIGHSVGFQNTGNYNNVVGYYAGYNNTGSNNDMMGYQAGRYLLASSSVVIGAEAMYGSHATNFVAPNNVAIGYRAGYTADDGAGANILIGYQVADNITTGNNNIIIGYDINALSATADNRLNIGNLIFGTGLDGTGSTLASGNVGVGTTTPAQKLQVFGNIRVGTSGANGCLEDFGGGVISGTCSSDENLKENIQPIEEENRSYLESLAALTPVTYNWNEEATELYSKSGSVENLGLIAQDVEAEFPELVSLNDEGYRQVDFRALPFYIIQALKEVWEKLQGQEDRIETLENENEYLKERIESIEDELDMSPAPTPVPEATEPVVEEELEPEVVTPE